MKGIKLCLLGISVCLAGLALSTNNLFAIAGGGIGLLLSLLGVLRKDL